MALASTDLLAPHFTAAELGADRPQATAVIVLNLRFTAGGFERVRSVLGVPLQVNTQAHPNRGFRPLDINAAVGGSTTSDHPRGLAGDFVPLGIGLLDAYNRLKRARDIGTLGPFDQIIFYPLSGHIHYGVGERMRGEFRIALYEGKGGTPLITAENLKALGGSVAAFVAAYPLLAVVLVVAIGYATIQLA